MPTEPYDFLELGDVVLYGLDEELSTALHKNCGLERANGLKSSVRIERALFRVTASGGESAGRGPANHPDGRYQNVVRGELFLADGFTSILQSMVLKIPRATSSADELAALEADRVAQLAGFQESFPCPLGHAIAEIGAAGDTLGGPGLPRRVVCNIQSEVQGSTLRELLYDDSASEDGPRPSREKILEFLKRFPSNAPWITEEEAIPLYPLITSLAIPLLDGLARIQDEGWQHCDISPSNIMIADGADGTPAFRLVDFALLSRLDAPPLGSGTRPYAPDWIETEGYGDTCEGLDARATCAIVWELSGLSAEHPSDPFGIRYLPETTATTVSLALAGVDIAHDVGTNEIKTLSVRSEIARFEKCTLLALQSVLLADRKDLPATARHAKQTLAHETSILPDRLRTICLSQHRELRNRAAENSLCIIFAAILLITFSVSDFSAILTGIPSHIIPFTLLSLAIAVAPTALGLTIDAPLAWAGYLRRLRSRGDGVPAFSWSAYKRVAKYGDAEGVVAGKGTFDPSFESASYYCLCNVLGSLCTISLACSVASLPDAGPLLAQIAHLRAVWAMALFTAGVIAFKTTVSMQELPWLPFQDEERENPDNSLFTRVHIWGNVVHLVWTFFWVIVLVFALVTFGATHRSATGLPWPFLCVEVATAVFLIYASLSKRARSIEAEAASSLASGLVALSAASLAFAWLVFPPTPVGLAASIAASALAAMCLAVSRQWNVWVRKHVETRIWVRRYARGGAFAPTVAICALVAVAIYLLFTWGLIGA